MEMVRFGEDKWLIYVREGGERHVRGMGLARDVGMIGERDGSARREIERWEV